MLIMQKLEEAKLAPSERAIVEFMMREGENIENMTVKQISDATYTVPSTLIRLAKKTGYNGWKELKEEYINELKYIDSHFGHIDANIPFEQEDTFIKIANKITLLNQQALEDTLNLLDHDHLAEVMRALEKCANLYVFTSGSNFPLAENFASALRRINIPCYPTNVSEEQGFQARVMKEHDLALIISYSGQTPYLVNLAKYLKSRKIKTICITSIGNNSLAELCDLRLFFSTREKIYQKIGTFSTTTSLKLILDILYACIFSLSYEENLNFKITAYQDLENVRVKKDFLIIED